MRRNVLSMKDQIAQQQELQKYLKNAKKLKMFLDHPQREELAGKLVDESNEDSFSEVGK